MKRRNWNVAWSMAVAGLAAAVTALCGLALWPALNSPALADGNEAVVPGPVEYDSPLEVLVSPDGARLYVLCQQSEMVRVFDAASYAPIKTIPVGRVPRGVALSASGDRLYVTNSWDDTLSVIDTRTLSVVATWSVGAEPSGVVADRAGDRTLCCQPHLQ